jgi:hypothetical protein
MIRDAFNRRNVSDKTGTEQTVNLAHETVKAAIEKEKVTTELQLLVPKGFNTLHTGEIWYLRYQCKDMETVMIML